ncbi:TonB-dependent receptor [Undibacterium cyanobacteriorum]|uniref:TonB-dependent receptor n=1 Tax=Undibacterium cyanobacteriorum TaxID=3073561 RepID=A0ABY9RKM9_9BURK|nr:TonB-dependent receptor [Undibacterium sp. 20NA77.5]WMW81511.1 TonB-dependent receptor [Undibacterium sp. 20NA77.5]
MPIKTKTMKQKVIAKALAIAFGTAVVSLGVGSTAFAQSNATGTIFGQAPVNQGVTVVIENTATGVSRVVTPDAKGKYQATSMPPGKYQVKLMRNGALEKSLEVENLIGQGVEASFVTEANVQTVTVAAKVNKIDVSNTNNGVILTARELAKLPISQNVQAVIALAPGTVRNVSGYYGNVSSFGGASVSENAYYINGFPVTNILTQVGASELPFGAISNAQILSGGYSSEFGRSTGGVVNITTKSGTNNWEAGGKISMAPASLAARPLNIYFPNTGDNPKTDGKLQFYNRDNHSTSKTVGLYVGGPLIKNKLFMFAALEQTRSDSEGVAASSDTAFNASGWSVNQARTTRGLVKLDYNLTDDHHFEYTHILDESRNTSSSYGFSYETFQRDNNKRNGSTVWNAGNTRGGSSGSSPGGVNDIFKYTGYLTDDLTVTALYGKSHTSPKVIPFGYNPAISSVSSSITSRAPGVTYPTSNPQPFGDQVRPDSGDKQQTLRLDIEYKLGAHSLRGGIDYNKASSVVGASRPGGRSWAYLYHNNPTTWKPSGANETLAQGGGYGTQGFYVSEGTYFKSGEPSTTQAAQYIQDRYQITDNILLDLGLRNEQFHNYNNKNQLVISQTRQIAPRLGATWDVNRDGSFKVFANAGRYFMPVPTNLVGNMGSELKTTTRYYTYTGVDPVTGVPQGLHPISDVIVNINTSPDARSVAAENIKPFYQDEMSLGFEKAISSSLNFGVLGTYRTLRTTYDDTCDPRPIFAWGKRNGYPNLEEDTGGTDNSLYPSWCMVINTGEANTVWFDPHGSGSGSELVKAHLTAADIGLPKAKRIYTALNFFLEHPFRDGWYGKINYTWSHNYGNTEGQTDSGVTGGDVALSAGSDYRELMIGSNGDLSGDRRHVIKAYGFYQVLPEVMVGANLQIASGRPRNCFGQLPEYAGQDVGHYEGNYFFFCDAKGGAFSPRGSQGRLPWTTQLDLNLSYQPSAIKGLNLKLDVFNVFDSRTINSENSGSNSGSGNISPTYRQGGSRIGARAARLTAEYNYKF